MAARRMWIASGISLVVLAALFYLSPGVFIRPTPGDHVGLGLGETYIEAAQKAPEDFYLFSRFGSGGTPSAAQLRAAAAQSRRVGRLTQRIAPDVASAPWKYIGANNIGGRVVDIAVDVRLEDTIYVAAATGGVWKSANAGRTYTSIWPKRWGQSIGALVIGQDGTLWAGTGETNPGGGSLTYAGKGLYRSRDRGKTWTNVGLRGSSTIGRIVVDPKDPDHVLVAVSGNLFKPGGPRGLYETNNGGATWNRILAPDNDTTGATDVMIDPQDPKRIFVAMWDHIRYPDWRDYAGPGSGIYRSTDGGKEWTRLGPSNGLPAPAENVSRIGLGMDPQDPQHLYAIYVSDLGTFQAWFISTNGGDLWIPPPGGATLADSQFVYGWWFGRVWVDPGDSNRVFVAGLPMMESNDGGMSFGTSHNDIHVDQHAMAWDPQEEGRIYIGNDGGVYRSDENGAVGSWVAAKKQPWLQFYTIDVSEQDPSRINGGLQDQGSIRSWGGASWNEYNGGDGVKNAINPTDKDNVFACSQYGACVRSDNGGGETSGMDQESSRYGWLTPIEFQPGTKDVMYWSGNLMARSEDRGQSWTTISDDLGEGELGREQNPLYAGHYGTIQAIGLNKAKPDVIYAGTDNANLWKTTDLGESWSKIESDALPERWVTHIQVKPRNPDVLYVTFSGFRQGDKRAYVFRSTNGGKSWTDITNNLPRAPVNDIVLVARRLYVASDVGVFTSKTGTIKWLKVGRGLPNVPCNDLRWIPKNASLYVGTFGRGIYKITP